MKGLVNIEGTITLGKGAGFWAYISPQHETSKNVTKWEVVIQQIDGNWYGKITSDNPEKQLQTPGLSGIFKVTVMASGPKFEWKKLEPKTGYDPNIGCNSNCYSMVKIVSNEDGADAFYANTWDAICSIPEN